MAVRCDADDGGRSIAATRRQRLGRRNAAREARLVRATEARSDDSPSPGASHPDDAIIRPSCAPSRRNGGRTCLRLATAAALIWLLSAPFGAPTGPAFAPSPAEPLAATPAAIEMSPWPIGLTLVRRATAPREPALDAALRALATPPSSASGQPAAACCAVAAAPPSAPAPTARIAPSRDAAKSFFADPLGFIERTSKRERPPNTDWSAMRER